MVNAIFTATAGAQGRSVTGDDWEEINLIWNTGGGPPPPPPPPPPQAGSAGLCSNLVEAAVNSCVGTDENGNPIARSHGCDGCVDPTTRIPRDVFLGIVRDDNGQSCMMPEGMLADQMMTCLCANPPTCVRGEAAHNQGITPTLPPPSPPGQQNCRPGYQPSSTAGGCQTCSNNHFSPDGSVCQVCPPGSGIVDNEDGLNTECAPCVGMLYSSDGAACVRCPTGKEPNAERNRCDTSAVPPPPPGAGNTGQTEDEDGIATAVVSEVMVDGIQGHTTYRVAVHIGGDARNIYTIYGQSTAGSQDHPMEIPAARQVATPFGVDVGGVNSAFFSVSDESQYDSWLTVGLTTGDTNNVISSVGILWDQWHETSGLHITDGAVFWMDPENGPQVASKDPVVMQLTVPNGCSFHGVFNAQGRTVAGAIDGNWDARNIQFHGGPGGECQQARAPPPPPPPPPPPRDPTEINRGGTQNAAPSPPSGAPAPSPPAGGSIVVVLVVLGAVGAVVMKKKQEQAGAATAPEGGIYAKNIVSSMLAHRYHVAINVPALR